jgi:hypothetical protein
MRASDVLAATAYTWYDTANLYLTASTPSPQEQPTHAPPFGLIRRFTLLEPAAVPPSKFQEGGSDPN